MLRRLTSVVLAAAAVRFNTNKAKVPQKAPYKVKVEAGKSYMWCSCGCSSRQPFCDGSHGKFNKENGTTFQPKKFTATESKDVFFCGCKQTKNPPMCDASHVTM